MAGGRVRQPLIGRAGRCAVDVTEEEFSTQHAANASQIRCFFFPPLEIPFLSLLLLFLSLKHINRVSMRHTPPAEAVGDGV